MTYLPEGAPFGFPEGDWPTPNGLHPWHGRDGWQGHGTLMLQRPDDSYAVWHFWSGEERQFAGWYRSCKTFRRTSIGYDTQDLELDIWVTPDGSGERWWPQHWSIWKPDPAWKPPSLPVGWESTDVG